MSADKHTAGPWTAVLGRSHQWHISSAASLNVNGLRRRIATLGSPTCYDPSGSPVAEENKANAKLIESAPDLLDIVEAIVALADSRTVEDLYRIVLDENSPLMDEAREVLRRIRDVSPPGAAAAPESGKVEQ